MSANPGLETEKPPQSYRLEDVSVKVTLHPGRGAFSARSVNLLGTGAGTLEQNGQKQTFQYATKDMMALLSEFYKIRFFELPANYSIRHSVFLKDDGTIGTTMLRMLDESSTSVCFVIVDYEKCVRYSVQGPAELEHIVTRIFSEASKRVNVK